MGVAKAGVLYGLIGFPLGHSFSKKYYDRKIREERISGVRYELFPVAHINDFPALLTEYPDLGGVNVTIPHKIAVMDYLDEVSEEARAIGAVNCIRIIRGAGQHRADPDDAHLTGYNTDAYGFKHSLLPLLDVHHRQGSALVLGNGGAAKAVHYVLRQLGISYTTVSRSAPPAPTSGQQGTGGVGQVNYDALTREMIDSHPLIINTTPLGMSPDVNDCPAIPYEFLDERHLLYDLVYNPLKTTFLSNGEARGTAIKNGYEMLELQAERNWEIWTEGL